MLKNALFTGVCGVLLHVFTNELFDFFIYGVRRFFTLRRANDVRCFAYFMLRLCNGRLILRQKKSPLSFANCLYSL